MTYGYETPAGGCAEHPTSRRPRPGPRRRRLELEPAPRPEHHRSRTAQPPSHETPTTTPEPDQDHNPKPTGLRPRDRPGVLSGIGSGSIRAPGRSPRMPGPGTGPGVRPARARVVLTARRAVPSCTRVRAGPGTVTVRDEPGTGRGLRPGQTAGATATVGSGTDPVRNDPCAGRDRRERRRSTRPRGTKGWSRRQPGPARNGSDPERERHGPAKRNRPGTDQGPNRAR